MKKSVQIIPEPWNK